MNFCTSSAPTASGCCWRVRRIRQSTACGRCKCSFDLKSDEQRVEFAKQAAELISTFGTAVEREIYGARAAEAAGTDPGGA